MITAGGSELCGGFAFTCSAISGLAGSATDEAAGSVFSALTSWLAAGAVGLVSHVLDLVSSVVGTAAAGVASSGDLGTDPTAGLTASWFSQQQGFMLVLMGFVVLPILLVSSLGALVRQDLGRLMRTWFVCLPLALVCTLAGVEVTVWALKLTDALSSAVVSGVSLTKTIGGAVGDLTSTGAGTDGPVAVVVIAILAIIGALLLWLELVMRSAAVYVAVLFLPLGMCGLLWPSTTHLAKRFVELLVSLILSKFVVASVLSLGSHAVAQGGIDGGLTGGALLLMAGFAPFVLFRMVPLVEAAALTQLEGLSRRPFVAAERAGQRVTGFTETPLGAALGLGGKGGAPDVTPSNVTAQDVPEMAGEFPIGGSGDSDGSGDGGEGGSSYVPSYGSGVEATSGAGSTAGAAAASGGDGGYSSGAGVNSTGLVPDRAGSSGGGTSPGGPADNVDDMASGVPEAGRGSSGFGDSSTGSTGAVWPAAGAPGWSGPAPAVDRPYDWISDAGDEDPWTLEDPWTGPAPQAGQDGGGITWLDLSGGEREAPPSEGAGEA